METHFQLHACCWVYFLRVLARVCEAARKELSRKFPFTWWGAVWHLAEGP